MALQHYLFSLLFLLCMHPTSILSTRNIPAAINGVAAGEKAHRGSKTSSSLIFRDNLVGSKKGDTVEGLHLVKQYLARFGYLDYHSSSDHQDIFFDESLETALSTYQLIYHLKVTGEIDSQTLEQMKMARCGFPDIINGTNWMRSGGGGGGNNNFSSHYAYLPSEPKWPPDKTHLTFAWMSRTDMNPLFFVPTRDAFQRWQAVTHFTFEEVVDPAAADIKLGFYKGDHGDGHPFDGPGHILGHSSPPPTGLLHLDAEEGWSTAPGSLEYDLESVVLHEIGHTLGMGHTTVKEAVMFATIEHGVGKINLHQDDIDGIRALYA